MAAEEFTRARLVMRDIRQTVEWNPWVQDDRAEEYAAALEIVGQWTRAEPGYRPQSADELRSEIDQQVAADRVHREAERARAEGDRAERAARYDRERDEARLVLLGQLAIVTARPGSGPKSQAESFTRQWRISAVKRCWKSWTRTLRPLLARWIS